MASRCAFRTTGRARRDARTAQDEQDARAARIIRDLKGVWRQQGERAQGGAAGQRLGLLNQHERIAEAVRQHDALLREQRARMGGGGPSDEQGERARRAGRDLDAGLRLLVRRAEQAGRGIDDGVRAQGDPGRGMRNDPGAGEVGDRFQAGARAGRENLVGQGGRVGGDRPNPEIDERARAADAGLTGRELEDRVKGAARGQREAVETRHGDEVQPPPKPEAPAPAPRVDDPARKEKERDDAERALEDRNRKARESAELRRLLAEREQRQRDLDELKKLLAEKEAQQRDADELKLLLAEKERLRRLRDGFKGITENPEK